MLHFNFFFYIIFLPVLSGTPPGSEEQKLNNLFEEYYQEYLQLHPLEATIFGDNRYDDMLEIDISSSYRKHLQQVNRDYLDKLNTFDYNALDSRQQENYDVFSYALKSGIAWLDLPAQLLPVNPGEAIIFHFIEMGSGTGWHPFKSVKDYDNFLARSTFITAWVDTAIYNMNSGLQNGIVHPRSVIEAVLPLVASQVIEDPHESTFYKPVENFPDHFSSQDKKRLAEKFISAIKTNIIPAYKKLKEYLEHSYLPSTRNTISLSDLPGGAEWYAFLVKFYTTTTLQPEQIFESGVAQVQTTAQKAQPLLKKLGLSGNLIEDIETLWSMDSLQSGDRDKVFSLYDAIKDTTRKNTYKLFKKIPEAPFEIREVEPYRQAASGMAFYNPPSEDGDRPGIFYVNFAGGTYMTVNMEALFLHEAWPGHHFQIALAQELGNVPSFRKFAYFGAYTEGWGLYAEKLGYELGLYRDVWQELGMLIADWERASRLIADTGIHYLGWTAEEAVEKLAQYNAAGAGAIKRFTITPGQALSYKIGEQKIWQLREKAQMELKDSFDIRDFHEVLLGSGPLPLAVLEKKVIQYINNTKKSAQSGNDN